jgi:hypothetical protein
MARKNEELRRRVEGKSGREDDDDESDFSGASNDIDNRKALLKELEDISDGDKAPTGLMAMKFMSKQLPKLLTGLSSRCFGNRYSLSTAKAPDPGFTDILKAFLIDSLLTLCFSEVRSREEESKRRLGLRDSS